VPIPKAGSKEDLSSYLVVENKAANAASLSHAYPPPSLDVSILDSTVTSSLESSSVYVEHVVPDPFLIDDKDDSGSDREEAQEPEMVTRTEYKLPMTITPAYEISLLPSTLTPPPTSPLPSLNLSKPVPPPPLSGSDPDDEEEGPELHLPGSVIPTMFLSIANVRRTFPSNHLTWWLSRHLFV